MASSSQKRTAEGKATKKDEMGKQPLHEGIRTLRVEAPGGGNQNLEDKRESPKEQPRCTGSISRNIKAVGLPRNT